MQFINTCIFCDNKSPSKEHIFPQWLKKIIREKVPTEFNRNLLINDGCNKRLQVFKKSANNPILSTQTKKVCKPCNNQWLSNFESSVIPIFTKLSNQQSVELSTEDQARLSMWAALLSIKWDLTDTNTSGHTKSDIKFIYNHRTLPTSFRVWVGYSKDDGIQAFHKTMILGKKNEAPPTAPNLRSTGLQLGTIILYILSHENNVYSELEQANHYNQRLVQIWPTNANVFLDRSKMKENDDPDLKITTLFFGMQDDFKFKSRMLQAFPELIQTLYLE